MDNRDEHSKPTYIVEHPVMINVVQGEKAFFKAVSEKFEAGLRQRALEYGCLESFVNDMPFIIRHKNDEFTVAIPIYAMGSAIPGYRNAPAMMDEYARTVGIYEHKIAAGSLYEVRGKSLRDLLNICNEGFLRRVDAQHCVDIDKIAAECRYDLDKGRSR